MREQMYFIRPSGGKRLPESKLTCTPGNKEGGLIHSCWVEEDARSSLPLELKKESM